MNEKKNFNRIMGIVFMTVLIGMFCFNALIPDSEISESENRALQQFPGFSVAEYMDGSLETKLENYANDQFLMRGPFIRLKTAMDVSAGAVYSNGVWKSQDGYLIEDTTVPTDDRMEADAQALAAFRKKYPKMRMYFLLAPNAVSIMGDKLPYGAQPEDQNRYMDEMFAATAAAGYTNIDVRDTLGKAATDGIQVYYRTDHHWTTDGAYEAFKYAKGIMGIKGDMVFETVPVANRFVGTLASKSGFANGRADAIKLARPADSKQYKHSVIYYEDTKEKTTAFYKMENLNLKDAYTVFGGSNHPVYTIKTPTSDNRRLLLVKDSYANSMIPFLSQYYREIVVVDPRYYYDNLAELMALESVNEVMFLYNANTYFGDDSLAMMLNN
ncbi:MAG: hypothetical protein KBS68_03255 [Clostridiales bacterium]|nr:hypothetical protein [Candidatus Crickella merdequi]